MASWVAGLYEICVTGLVDSIQIETGVPLKSIASLYMPWISSIGCDSHNPDKQICSSWHTSGEPVWLSSLLGPGVDHVCNGGIILS